LINTSSAHWLSPLLNSATPQLAATLMPRPPPPTSTAPMAFSLRQQDREFIPTHPRHEIGFT
jgi:hypothetical protein